MPKFYYRLLTKENNIKEGYISAKSKKNAEKELLKEGAIIIYVSNDKNPSLSAKLPFLQSGFSAAERINFFYNLSTMVDAGIPIVESLEITSGQVKSKALRNAILAIAQETKNGQKISDAMAKFPNFFSENLVETINVGEVSGKLSETFDRISTDLEKNDELRKKVQMALIYPVIVIVFMTIVITVLITFVLPGIEDMYKQFDASLPLPTRILISIGKFIAGNLFLIPVVITIISISSYFSIKIKKSRYAIHFLMLKIPVFGNLIRDYNLVIFFRSFRSLFGSGVSIITAVDIAKKTANNDVIKKALDGVSPALIRGTSFADALLPYPFIFPAQTQKILKVGEKAGKTEEILNRITSYYEHLVDYKTRTMITIIEPILMIMVGTIVGGLAISIIYPIYHLAKVIE